MESGSFDIPGAEATIRALCIAESAVPTDSHVILFSARMGPMEVRLIGAGTRAAGTPIRLPTTGGSDKVVIAARMFWVTNGVSFRDTSRRVAP